MTLPAIPEGCTCSWATMFHEDGHRSGSIHIAAEECPAWPHFRLFNEHAKPGRDLPPLPPDDESD